METDTKVKEALSNERREEEQTAATAKETVAATPAATQAETTAAEAKPVKKHSRRPAKKATPKAAAVPIEKKEAETIEKTTAPAQAAGQSQAATEKAESPAAEISQKELAAAPVQTAAAEKKPANKKTAVKKTAVKKPVAKVVDTPKTEAAKTEAAKTEIAKPAAEATSAATPAPAINGAADSKEDSKAEAKEEFLAASAPAEESAIYLIDFENVGCEGLAGAEALCPADRVVIFYSEKSDRLSFGLHLLISRCSAVFEYLGVTVGGKNALDHQLSTYLGYLIGNNASGKYYVVSKDRGYRFLADFWDLRTASTIECVDSVRTARTKRQTRPLIGIAQDARLTERVLPAVVSEALPRATSRRRTHASHGKAPVVEVAVPVVEMAMLEEKLTPVLPELPSLCEPHDAMTLFQEFGFHLNPDIEAQIAKGEKDNLYLSFVKQLGQEKGLALYYKAKKLLWK